MVVSRGFGHLKSCSGWGQWEGTRIICWNLDSTSEQAASLEHEAKGRSPEAFLPPNIFLSDSVTSTLPSSTTCALLPLPQLGSNTNLQILRENLLCHSLLTRCPLHVLILAPGLTWGICELLHDTSQLYWAWALRWGTRCMVILVLLFQASAVLLWGQPVKSPERCNWWVLPTANSSKCTLCTALSHECVCWLTHLLIHEPEIHYDVLSHHRRALCSSLPSLISQSIKKIIREWYCWKQGG